MTYIFIESFQINYNLEVYFIIQSNLLIKTMIIFYHNRLNNVNKELIYNFRIFFKGL